MTENRRADLAEKLLITETSEDIAVRDIISSCPCKLKYAF